MRRSKMRSRWRSCAAGCFVSDEQPAGCSARSKGGSVPVIVTVADDGRVSVVLKPKPTGHLSEAYSRVGEYFVLSNPGNAVAQESIALGFIDKAPNLTDVQKQEARTLLAKNRAIDYVAVVLVENENFVPVFAIAGGAEGKKPKSFLINFIDP